MQKNASFIIANAHGSAFSLVSPFYDFTLAGGGNWSERGRGLCEHSPHIFFFRIKRENSTNKHIFARSKWLSSLTPHHQAARTGLYKYFCFNLFLHKISCKQKQINFANCLFQLPVSAFFKQATFHSGKGV